MHVEFPSRMVFCEEATQNKSGIPKGLFFSYKKINLCQVMLRERESKRADAIETIKGEEVADDDCTALSTVFCLMDISTYIFADSSLASPLATDFGPLQPMTCIKSLAIPWAWYEMGQHGRKWILAAAGKWAKKGPRSDSISVVRRRALWKPRNPKKIKAGEK